MYEGYTAYSGNAAKFEASFFVNDLALALVAKTCPHRPQAFKRANNGEAFP